MELTPSQHVFGLLAARHLAQKDDEKAIRATLDAAAKRTESDAAQARALDRFRLATERCALDL